MPISRKRKKKGKAKRRQAARPRSKLKFFSVLGRLGDIHMGYYTEYIDRHLTFDQLNQERKTQLSRISEPRDNRDVLVIASDLNALDAPTLINYSDLLPVNDQLSYLNGASIDVILETPGGFAEVAEDIVRLLRGKYESVAFIIPGYAKSAGTIMAMAGDEILMEPISALGPIDAQLSRQGKTFSADALLEGFEKIKEEIERTGVLNKAYIPILQSISPGEIQSAENALKFTQILVREWLAQYKFKNWDRHSTTGEAVTDIERTERAREIAAELCDHRRWLTHGRSLKLDDLERMRLRITDYSKSSDLAEAIRRYYTLLQMTFASTVYKVFETPHSQIVRLSVSQVQPSPLAPNQADGVVLEVSCPRCHAKTQLQANFGATHPIAPGVLPFPMDNIFRCPQCQNTLDLSDLRREIEAKAQKPLV